MRIGYPCINRGLGCTSSSTFRLKNYSEELLIEKIESNLSCLKDMLEYNLTNSIFFFRMSSDIIPFASHPVLRLSWQEHFAEKLKSIGSFIKSNKMRLSMHPDQFVVLNSKSADTVENSISELIYHAELMDLMGLESDAKIQIHLGGVYSDKKTSLKRFSGVYRNLPSSITRRLVIENDDRNYSLEETLEISKRESIPVVYDTLHQSITGIEDSRKKNIIASGETWKEKDGIPIVDYSSQLEGGRKGRHAETLYNKDFALFLKETSGEDFDIMLEIKDKETSALKALNLASSDKRLFRGESK